MPTLGARVGAGGRTVMPSLYTQFSKAIFKKAKKTNKEYTGGYVAKAKTS